jgi:metal-responsive CopG/Arc/MetJ family transcriptional regulator
MACRKTAITVPEKLLAEIDRAAQRRGKSRSSFIVSLLEAAVRARHDAEITRRFNEVFSNPETGAGQLREATDLDDLGSDWADERW